MLLGFPPPRRSIYELFCFFFLKKKQLLETFLGHFWKFGFLFCSLGKRTNDNGHPAPNKKHHHFFNTSSNMCHCFVGCSPQQKKLGGEGTCLQCCVDNTKQHITLWKGKPDLDLAYSYRISCDFLHQLLLKGFPIHLNGYRRTSATCREFTTKNMGYWRFRPLLNLEEATKKKTGCEHFQAQLTLPLFLRG